MTAPHILITDPGALTTVQDRGRFGWEHVGIARGGALDVPAYTWANRLAYNSDDAAVLEMTLTGATLQVSVDCWVATTGADHVTIDGTHRPAWAGFWLGSGAVLALQKITGARAYLAIQGGILVPPILGSRSTNLESGFGGFHGRGVRAGDELAIAPAAVPVGSGYALRHPHPPRLHGPICAPVVIGPRASSFVPGAAQVLLESQFRVSHHSNHVGLRLDEAIIPAPPRGTRISEPMPIGGIQVTPAGQPVVLLGSRGTVGGYPLLATVVTTGVWTLGQARPGDVVCFKEVTPAEGRALIPDALGSAVRPIAVPL